MRMQAQSCVALTEFPTHTSSALGPQICRRDLLVPPVPGKLAAVIRGDGKVKRKI